MKTNTIVWLWALLCFFPPTLTKAQQIVGNQQVITIPFTAWSSTQALLSLPDDYQTSSTNYPLIIFLHGWGESGTLIDKLITTALPQRIATGFKPTAVNPKDGKQYKFIVVSPQAPDFSYQSSHVTAILADVRKKYRIDTTRIYISGVSAGGYGTWSCVADDTSFCKKIAAIAPVSSMAVDGNRPNTINNAGKYGLGVWSICGTIDDKWTIAVDYTNRVNAVSPKVPAKLTGLTGLGHTSAAWNQAYDPAFKVDNMNLYEWFLQFTSTANGQQSSNSTAANCPGRRRVLTPLVQNGQAGVYMNGANVAHSPGDTFVIRSQYNPWIGVDIENFHGTADCPIVIINEGDVKMAAGFKMSHCTYVKVTGSGTASKYGFDITGTGGGVALEVTGRSANVEIERIKVHKKTYGAWVKQEAHCADSLKYPNWWIDNISLHDCHFLNIAQDGLYFGSTSPNGSRTVLCNGVNITPIPLRLSNIKIYNNIVDSCMRTAIQVSGADRGNNEIYNNTVLRCGYELNQTQGSGIILGGVTRAYVHDNYIRQTFQHGVFCIGSGPSRVENNNIDSSGILGTIVNSAAQPTGIFVDTRPTVPAGDSTLIYIKNNLLGKNAVVKGEHIIVLNSTNTFAIGNQICGNITQGATSAAALYVAPTINWTICPVNPINQHPIANAGINQTITLPTNRVNLQGAGSDIDGTVVGYSWAKISGPATFNIVSSTSASTEVNNLVAGVYVFELTVTDDKGAIGRATVQITVNGSPANQAPTANAGSNQTITLPTGTVHLQGSGTDPDGSIVSYSWAKLSGPASFSIVNSTSASTDVTYLVAGVYVFELTVTDDKGATGKATVQITVNPAINQPPVANAGTNQTITLPTNSVTLQGSGTDADGSIASYSWAKISGPASFTIVSSTSAGTNVTNLAPGVYLFELTVTDDKGATGKATVQVTVNDPANQLPAANAGTNQTITLPTNSVTLQGSGTDADGSIVSYSWSKLSGPATFNIVSSTSASTDVTNLVAGVYVFELTVTDDKGATGRATVQITVNAANQPPVANAGTNQTITLPTSRVTLQGSGTDADGSIVSYSWAKISGPTSFNIVSSTSASTDVTNLVAGVYVFELTVTDDKGATARATVQVTVNPVANQLPVANAGADQTIILPTNRVTLQGTGTDADGSIVSYTWTKISGPASYNIVSSTSASTDVTDLVAGVYVFQLAVRDNNNAVGSDQITITVYDPVSANRPPIAIVGNDTVIVHPASTAVLNGENSRAGGNPIVSYRWLQLAGPAQAMIVNPNAAKTNVENLQKGTYLFQLTVTDSRGLSSSATLKVAVIPAPSQDGITLYPNPASSYISYSIAGEKDTKLTIAITDVHGHLLTKFEETNTNGIFNKTIHINQLKAGTYFLVVYYPDGHKKVAKFIKI